MTPAARFCAQCGAALVARARFCSACGTPVAVAAEAAPPAPAQGERRQVTVLFADLAGYTRLSGALDPEETNILLVRYFEALDGIVTAYGGSVLRHVGDAVLSVFGAPVAHDNDPERAVRAAVDIHAAMDRLSLETGHDLQVHAGIAAGEVVAVGLGSEVYSEYTVTGDAVNLAARLCSLTEAGETMIAQSVHEATRHIIGAHSVGEIAVKGFASPVRAWRVGRLLPQRAGQYGTPLAGRRGELRQFEGILAAVRETGEGQAVYLRGEPGIGKTRLAEEFAARAAAAGFATHKGLVLDFGIGRGRDAIGALLRSVIGLSPDADEAARQAAVDELIAGGALERDHRVFLHDLLDLPQPTALRALYDAMNAATRSRGRETALAALVRHASRVGPLLLLVEDLHWADAATLAQLAALAGAVVGASAVLVMTSRTEGDPIDAAWRSRTRDTPFTTFDLGPLRETEARALAAAIADAASRFVGACLARAGGNPLFLVQLLHAAEQASADSVPDSIQSLVLARMDRLPPLDRRALQAAAVLGQNFGLAALRHLIGEPDYRCDELLRKYLIRPEGDDFLFAHALIRDGVYASLTRQARRDLHRRAAEWLGDREPVLAAEHLDRAEDPAASQAYLRAAMTERERFDFDRALALAARGLALARDPADRFALAHLHADCLREVGRAQDSVAGFHEALALAEGEADRGRAWIGVAAGLRILSRPDEAMAALDEAERALAGADLPRERGQIHFIRGNLHFARGESALCLASHERALALARRAGDAQLEANALGGLGDGHYAGGRMRAALSHFQQCSDLCRARGFGRIDVSTRFMIGHCLRYQNDLATGLAEHQAQIAAAARIGNRLAEMTARQSEGILLVEMGRYAEALDALAAAQALSCQLGTRRFDAIILVHSGAASIETGRRGEGQALIDEGVAIARETGMGFVGPAVLGFRALYAADGDVALRALAEAEMILAQGCIGHNYFWFYRDAIQTSLLARRWDEALRYAQALADYTAAEPLAWSDFNFARARALVAFGRGDRSPGLRAELGVLRDRALAAQLAPAVPLLDAALAERWTV
jgi:class 3 adenylate cyclase/tetratricopeptide (TPR) repeat protein